MNAAEAERSERARCDRRQADRSEEEPVRIRCAEAFPNIVCVACGPTGPLSGPRARSSLTSVLLERKRAERIPCIAGLE